MYVCCASTSMLNQGLKETAFKIVRELFKNSTTLSIIQEIIQVAEGEENSSS